MIAAATFVLMSAGLFFFLVGTLGLLRFPDALTRAHGAAKCDTLGALLCLLGLSLNAGTLGSGIKLLLIVVFLWVANPTSTHLIARGIHHQHNSAKEATDADV